jgi:hypothetical protein
MRNPKTEETGNIEPLAQENPLRGVANIALCYNTKSQTAPSPERSHRVASLHHTPLANRVDRMVWAMRKSCCRWT